VAGTGALTIPEAPVAVTEKRDDRRQHGGDRHRGKFAQTHVEVEQVSADYDDDYSGEADDAEFGTLDNCLAEPLVKRSQGEGGPSPTHLKPATGRRQSTLLSSLVASGAGRRRLGWRPRSEAARQTLREVLVDRDQEAEIRLVKPNVASAMDPLRLGEIMETGPVQDAIVQQAPEENVFPDAEDNFQDDDHDDADDSESNQSDNGRNAVVGAHNLAKIFDSSPSFALPPVQDLFRAVASLYLGKSKTTTKQSGAMTAPKS